VGRSGLSVIARRPRRARLLFFVEDRTGHLVAASRAPGRLVRIAFGVAALDVIGPDGSLAALPWDGARVPIAAPGAPAKDAWRIEDFATSRQHPAGIAVRVTGAFETRCARIADATRSWTYRLYWANAFAAGAALPILRGGGFDVAQVERERETLRALVELLAARPEVRPRLAASDRVARLGADITAHVVARPAVQRGFRYRTSDLLDAVRAAGLWHPLGRPVPGDALVPLDEAVARVRSALHNGRHHFAAGADDATIERGCARRTPMSSRGRSVP
jgi:hypothetical protein